MEYKDLADKLQSELNLDDGDDAEQLMTDLVEQSAEIVRDSISNDKEVEEYISNPIFIRAVFTLATQLYYDRELSDGLSKGLQMMLNHLRGQESG